jgi:hypothetical protein
MNTPVNPAMQRIIDFEYRQLALTTYAADCYFALGRRQEGVQFLRSSIQRVAAYRTWGVPWAEDLWQGYRQALADRGVWVYG